MTEARNEQDRRDILIARIVDGNATSEDWRELRATASDDQTVWAEIAEQQELKRELEAAMDDAGGIAERVELPMHEHASVTPRGRLRLAMTAGGWLAAACVLVAWTMGTTPEHTVPALETPAANSAGLANPINTASEALKKYLDLGKQSGEVIGELPTSLVLERTPRADGTGYDVVYLRQIVERTTVKDIYATATNDAGQTFVVPKETPAQRASDEPSAW